MLDATDRPISRDLRRLKLLLVDDDPMSLRALRRIIETNQPYWEISCAATGEQALEMIARESYAAVITDLVMPGTNGMTVLFQLQQRQPAAVRIVHSSHTEMLASGRLGTLAQRMLPKPASAIDVLALTTWARQQHCQAASPASSRCA